MPITVGLDQSKPGTASTVKVGLLFEHRYAAIGSKFPKKCLNYSSQKQVHYKEVLLQVRCLAWLHSWLQVPARETLGGERDCPK